MNNEIPDGWSFAKVGDAVLSAEGGVSVNSENRPKTIQEFGILKTSSVVDGRFYPKEHKVILCNEIGRASVKPQKGHILFSRMNTPVLVGQSGFVDKDYDDLFIPDRLWQIKVATQFNAKWLSYKLRSQEVVKYITDAATGTSNTMKNIAKPNLMAIRMIHPPLPEQEKIAQILTSVDEVLEKTQAQINKLKDLKTSMMQELLTKGIGHTEFKDTPIGKIPVEWEVKHIESVLTVIIDYRGKAPPKSEIGIPLITAKNIRKGYINESPKEYIFEDQYDSWMVRGMPKCGDVFITTEAPLGNVARVPSYKFAIGQRVLTLRPLDNVINTDFLLLIMQSESFRKQLDLQSTGSTVAGIKQSTFRKILLPLPSIQKQIIITKHINSIISRISIAEVKLTQLRNIKKALMQDLLTGKVRVKVDQ